MSGEICHETVTFGKPYIPDVDNTIQCAWCLNFCYRNWPNVWQPFDEKLNYVSHGICPVCLDKVKAKETWID